MKTLNDLAKDILAVNATNGWQALTVHDWDNNDYKIPAHLALIHSEISEALEAFRNNDFENFKEEMADIIIRVLSCCGKLPIDIELIVNKKIEVNRNRKYKHGGKRL